MKKIFYTLLTGVIALSSCGKETVAVVSPQEETTKFTISVDELQTRANTQIAPVRYIMEVWSEDGSKAENVFENNTKNHAEILAASGDSFTITLDKTKAYTCLFWADDNATFDAKSLVDISLNTGKDMVEAYHAKVSVSTGKHPEITVTLKRAVAKIILTEVSTVKTTDNLFISLSNIYSKFSVLTGNPSGTPIKWLKTITPLATTGTIGSLYFFANTEKRLSELNFRYAAEEQKTISNIPLQQNYTTNLKGEYSAFELFEFVVTADDMWDPSDNNVVLN